MIGIDVGGANLKIADGKEAKIEYCPLWEGADLYSKLAPYRHERAAVVITGELADCFLNRMDGITRIVTAVRKAIPSALFYGMDARFHSEAVPQLAAANWLASADLLIEGHQGEILVDMGSTTTDIIPLFDLHHLLGLSDLQRLQRRYLVYTGLLRTPVAAMVSSLSIAGIRTPVSSELFAIAADVHRILGHISDEEYTCPAPDGRGKSYQASIRRLSRMVCADPEEIGTEAVHGMASEIWERQLACIRSAIGHVISATGAEEIITAGTGSRILARELGGKDLADEIGIFAEVLPAYAVREVALRNAGHSH